VVLLACGLLLLAPGCSRRGKARATQRPAPAPVRTFHLQLDSIYDGHNGPRWSVMAMALLRHEPGCAPLSSRAQARFGGVDMRVSTGGMGDAPGLNFFGEQRCREPAANGAELLPAQAQGPGLMRHVTLTDGTRRIDADVKLGHWKLPGEVRTPARPGERLVLEWNLPEAPPREVKARLSEGMRNLPATSQWDRGRLFVQLPAGLAPGTYDLSITAKVENAVSGCTGAPRCTATLTHEERRVLDVR
jgi:hypothetical protein